MKRICLLAISAYFFTSCSPSLKLDNMRVKEDKYIFSATNKRVNVNTSKTFRQKLFKTADYQSALIQSIEHSKLLIVDPSASDYQITAILVHWFQPPYSTTFHTDLRVHYTIRNGTSVVFDKEIESHSVAKMSETWNGTKRSIMSMERAVRQNIEEFITEVSKLKL